MNMWERVSNWDVCCGVVVFSGTQNALIGYIFVNVDLWNGLLSWILTVIWFILTNLDKVFKMTLYLALSPHCGCKEEA